MIYSKLPDKQKRAPKSVWNSLVVGEASTNRIPPATNS